ncbi:MAG: diphosphomevalonate decarboxylase [Haliscomenobacteraceae bacterium CHB4]|nr:diphosphomevalonate decarboxylase [Haliscomenobacteraceae bacterium CHB4]
MYENPRLILDSSNPPEPGAITWRSPSNIAIIKYWGKHGVQLPRNPSLSLTLAASCTDTRLEYAFRDEAHGGPVDLDLYFHQQANEAFRAKTLAYLESLAAVYPFLKQLKLTVHTGNSFPHSAGIASSASAMSALALCLCSLEDKLFGTLQDTAEFDRKASYLARLGSGSACRSIFPYAALWGETALVPGSSNEFAVPVGDLIHEQFRDFHDDILIVSTEEKAVSSRAGHALMDDNPFAEPRYAQARQRLDALLSAMRTGDLETFGKIVEDEALTLHALMMSGNSSYLLIKPDSLAIIEKVREYRAATGQPVYFTLDAGPNVHLLYPGSIVHEVRKFIEDELAEHCENGYVQQDWVGEGPEEL